VALGPALVELPLIRPMLATPGTRLPAEPDQWAVEVKWDGVRIAAYLDGAAGLRLLTRNAHSATERFPEAAELLDLLPGTDAVFDCEIIATGPDGRPSFGRLQERMSLRRPAAIRVGARTFPVTVILFDLLWLNGHPLTSTDYRGRRKLLESLPLDGHCIAVPPAWPGSEADAALEWTAQQGLEGVIAKRLDSSYQPGVRSRDWIKFKHTKSLDVIVGGWIPAGTTVRALLLGVRDGADLRYVGRVGAGFSDAERKALAGLLSHLGTDRSPFTAGPALPRSEPLRFVRPDVTAEVDYLDVTDSGVLHHPVWRGLRGAHAD
jgi:bifunctional non-homologous end joining protein LigD